MKAMVGGTVGFTGTREGMTTAQYEEVKNLLIDLEPELVVHGDCIGADADFNEIVLEFKGEGIKVGIELRPGMNKYRKTPTRAFCSGARTIHPTRPYIARDEDIVKQADVMIACPSGFKEERRSGTWTTIRRARTYKTDVYIVFPDGAVDEEENSVSSESKD